MLYRKKIVKTNKPKIEFEPIDKERLAMLFNWEKNISNVDLYIAEEEIEEVIFAFEKEIKNAKLKSESFKSKFSKAKETTALKLETLNKKLTSNNFRGSNLKERIQDIINLDICFDVTTADIDNQSTVLAIEVADSRDTLKELLSVSSQINASIKSEQKSLSEYQEKTNTERNKLKVEIDGMIIQLNKATDKKQKILKVIDPKSFKKLEQKTKQEEEVNSTPYIIGHIAFSILLFPLFGPVAGIAAVVNFWRLTNKWKKQAEERDYKSKV